MVLDVDSQAFGADLGEAVAAGDAVAILGAGGDTVAILGAAGEDVAAGEDLAAGDTGAAIAAADY